MQKVDAEIRRIIDEQYALARKLHRGQPRQGRGDGQGAARVGDASTPTRSTTSWQAARRVRRSHADAGQPDVRPDAGPDAAPRRRRPDRRRRSPRLHAARCRRLMPSARFRPATCAAPGHARAQLRPLPPDARPAAGHGRAQRHARFVLRRRPVSRCRRARSRTRAACSRDGADIIDIGGESTRPGAAPVPPSEELERVIPARRSAARRERAALGRHAQARGDARGDRRRRRA